MKQIMSTTQDIEQTVALKLCEEPDFTGKITVEINCNQGGITNVDMYTLRKIKK